jgi:tetratricopeptide (TPR) repeat protein
MADAGTISWNNYGSMKAEIGEFGEAIDMYNRDKYKYGGVKNLMEPYYYLPMLNIYAGKTKEAMDIAKEAIAYSNSSPGFGWYNLALARSFMYNGQLDSAWITLEKAANFKEVHIGTTLTQPQYDFTVGLLKLVWFNQKINAIKFVHPNWWYHPIWFYEVAALEAKKYTHEYVLANQLALNPERARIIYDLFCGESTVSYDEIYYLMERFSPSYFMKLMADYYQSDPRIRIKPYFELYQARLLWHREKYAEAGNIFNNLLNKAQIDSVNEKLFMARLYEGLWQKAVKDKNNSAALKYQNLLFEYYPTLIPFANQPFQLQLQTKGLNNAVVQSVLAELKTTSLKISNTPGIPKATLSFAQKGIKYEVTIDVYNQNGILQFTERFLFRDKTDVAAEIAFRIFGKKGGIELEPPVQPNNKAKS